MGRSTDANEESLVSQLQAMLLSLLIEVPLAVGITALAGWLPRQELRRLAVAAIAATLLSHPLVWLAITQLQPLLQFAWRALIVETGAILLEAVVYARLAHLGYLRGMALSTLANGASFGAGLVIHWAVRWG